MRRLLSLLLLVSSALGITNKSDIIEPHVGLGYKIMYDAETWKDAKKTCAGAGGQLAIPRSQHNFEMMQGLVRKMHYRSIRGCTGNKLLVWLGISSTNDTVWRTVEGDDIEKSGFSTWAKGNGDKSSDPKEPHCVVLDAVNPGLRSYWCYYKQPFICEFEKAHLL